MTVDLRSNLTAIMRWVIYFSFECHFRIRSSYNNNRDNLAKTLGRNFDRSEKMTEIVSLSFTSFRTFIFYETNRSQIRRGCSPPPPPPSRWWKTWSVSGARVKTLRFVIPRC